MRRIAWSHLKSATEPGLPRELRLLIELLQVLPAPKSGASLILRPSNVLVAEDGTVSVGAARMEGAQQEQRYLAPEVEGQAGGNLQAAIYAVGAMLFEAVSGYPFESAEMVQQELFGSRAMAKAAGLGSQFWEIYLLEAAARATSPDPAQRWATPAEFAKDLRWVAKERIASREALAELVADGLSASSPPRRKSQQLQGSSLQQPGAPSVQAAEQPSNRLARPSQTAAAGRALGDAEATVAVATLGRFARRTDSPFEVEPKTLPRHTTSTGHFDPEPVTLPRFQPDTKRHQTLLGVGVGVVQQALEAARAGQAQATSGRPSAPAGRHQTLLGVGLRAPPDSEPIMLVKRTTPAPDQANRPASVDVENGDGVQSLPSQAAELTSDAPDSAQLEISVPPVENSELGPVLASEPWSETPKKRSRGLWLVLALLTLCMAAGALEYQGGHVTHSLKSLRPLVVESPTTPQEKTPAERAHSAVPPASMSAPSGTDAESIRDSSLEVGAGEREQAIEVDLADAGAQEEEAAKEDAQDCDDCEPGSPTADAEPAASAKPRKVPRRRAPKAPKRRRKSQARDYGI